VTAVKLLNASTDRSQNPHHYIDLLTNADVQENNGVLTYQLKPVSDELAGTYTVGVWAVKNTDSLDNQTFALRNFQLGTATVEAQIVSAENCGQCHYDPTNGKYYFHHIDPGHSPTGSPALDSVPVQSCKACHSNNGYAAYHGDVNDPSAGTDVLTPDPIVRRVHGVHMGEGLENPFNTDPATGNFKDYTSVVFPANVENCTYCHTDDWWKTEPSIEACGSCHDNIWFGATADMPATAEAHPGGPQSNDQLCSACHPADGTAASVSVAHDVTQTLDKLDITLSPPANGKYYVDGEAPVITINVLDDNGNVVAPAEVTDANFSGADLFVYGPRDMAKPVLTLAAHNIGTGYDNPNDLLDPGADPAIAVTANGITYQLDAIQGLDAGTYMVYAFINPKDGALPTMTANSAIGLVNFQIGTATVEPKTAENCTDCHGDTIWHDDGTHIHPEPFDTDYCLACHDYGRGGTGDLWSAIGGNSTSGFAGYGAQPLSARVHGLHYGAYLDHPEYVTSNGAFSDVIFPQDIRDCQKCHDASTSGAWNTDPNRLACSGCHNDGTALAHMNTMIDNFNRLDPYSSDSTQACEVCHGADGDFAPAKVHNISDPYQPPYPRNGGE